jgi:DNA-binding beta-propeller fold protein YncE
VLGFEVYRFLYGNVTVLRVGVSPNRLVVSPDSRIIYLANANASITPVSAATGRAGKPIAIRGGVPQTYGFGGLAVTPDGRTLFTVVLNEDSQSYLPLARVDLRSGKETGQVGLPGGVANFVLSRDGRTLYAVTGNNAFYAVNEATGRPERRIPVSASLTMSASAMVLSPDGRTLYMAVSGDDTSGTGTVVPVNLETGAAGRAVSVGWQPLSLAVTPDGRTLYVAVDGMDGEAGQLFPNRIVAIDTATDRVRASIPWKVPPLGLAMTPDGATVWVTSAIGDRSSTADDTVTPVSVASDQPGPSLRTAGWLNWQDDAPTSVAISPDGRRLYVSVSAGMETFSTS